MEIKRFSFTLSLRKHWDGCVPKRVSDRLAFYHRKGIKEVEDYPATQKDEDVLDWAAYVCGICREIDMKYSLEINDLEFYEDENN